MMRKIEFGMRFRTKIFGFLVALSFCSTPSFAQAPSYPAKVIVMIVPYAPGGSADAGARIIAEALSEQLGRQVVVENKPGASTNIGTAFVAKAPPDGYTILYNTSALTLNPALNKLVPYDLRRDFAPIGTTMVVPLALVVPAGLLVNTVDEFLAYAKANSGKIANGHAGVGTITHISAVQLTRAAGFSAIYVPYKGSGPAIVDLVAGRIQFVTDTVNNSIQLAKQGRLRILAVSSDKRLSMLPDVPTFAEASLADVGSGAWSGIVAPAGTPTQIVERLNTEIRKALHGQKVLAQMALLAAEPMESTPSQYREFLNKDLARWAEMVKAAGIEPE